MSRRRFLHAAVLGVIAAATRPLAQVEDIIATIEDRALAHGVSPSWLVAVARCESTFNPYAVNGPNLGLFQLASPGMRDAFYAMGYDDIWSAWQQSDFTAIQFARGRAGAWSCS